MNQECALQYRLAAALRELAAREGIDGSSLRLTRWLHGHFGLIFGVAREKVRTALVKTTEEIRERAEPASADGARFSGNAVGGTTRAHPQETGRALY